MQNKSYTLDERSFILFAHMDELSFIVATHVERATHSIAKHLVGYATMQYMDQGKLFVQYDRREYSLEGKWFWPCYPGPYTVFHRTADCLFWNHRHLAFQGSLVAHWMATGLWPTEPQPAPTSRDWSLYFDEMSRLAMTPTRIARLRALNMLEGLLLELAEARETPIKNEPWLESVLTEMSQEGADYTKIARTQGMALSTFRRRFLKATGTSVHQHTLQTRATKARTMLIETDLPIKAIADSLGYQNVFYFSRQFKQLIGVSPAQFRASK